MVLRKRLARPVIALLVGAVGAGLFALPATSVSQGTPAGLLIDRQVDSQAARSSDRLLFVENVGQWPEAVRFQVWGSPAGFGTTWLADDAIWISIVTGSQDVELDRSSGVPASVKRAEVPSTGVALMLAFPGSNPDVRIEPLDPLTTTVSYFIGNDPARWHAAVPVYGGVRYANLYPGVDLVVDNQDTFWRLEVDPGAETSSVRAQIAGAQVITLGDTILRLASQNEPLSIALPSAPFAYQVSGVASEGKTVVHEVHASVNTRRSPVAFDDDPGDMVFSTFLGGGASDCGVALALDTTGRATVAGYTASADFPTTPGVFDPSHNDGEYDAFVVRLNASGSALDYATFLGGTGMDVGMALALDATGRATITGSTLSSDFPITPGAYDTSYGGNWDVFIVRLNAAGSALDYATFLGGGANDGGNALALDAAGFAVVTGETESRDFPTTLGAFASGLNGYYGDTFVARLNPAGSALAYATFLGGSSHDSGSALALYEDGRIIVAGETVSRNFPTTPGAFDPNCGESLDAFVVRFDATGGSLDYATCLGGPSLDRASALALDATGRATVTGLTQSDSFPTTPGAFDSSYNGGDDVFIVRLNATGDALDYGTFLGGSSHDDSLAISVDANDRATVSGWTQSSDFPTTSSAFDTSHNGRHDAIVARLSADGSTLEYATFLGGSDDDRAFGLALDTFGRATVTGRAGASDFPITLGAVNPSFSGGYLDAFVTKLAMTTVVSSSYLPLIVHD